MDDRLILIYDMFKNLDTVIERIEFLQDLKSQNLPYSINYERLIEVWSAKIKF
jgi:hypothetical protein